MVDPLFLDFKENCLDDGPGIRTAIFFKGCNLSCRWCHNPEAINPRPALSFDADVCVGCHQCATVCPEPGAISITTSERINRDRCTLCFECTKTCPSGALSRVGVGLTTNEIIERVCRDRAFFDASGGGVTLSGGEATIYMQHAGEIASRLHNQGIDVLLQTAGHFHIEKFSQQLEPYLNTIYFDLKLIDDRAHRLYCGRSNERILENFRILATDSRKRRPHFLPRVTLVPEITSTIENLEAVAELLVECSIRTTQLLEYNPMWPQKSARIGRANEMNATNNRWLSPEEVAACHAVFHERGISTSAST